MCSWCAGQTASLRFERTMVSDGLSHHSVYRVFQDSRGIMWLGTGDGLNRFDGYSFKVYKNQFEDPTLRRGRHIFSIIEDAGGFLWIGSGSGLSRFDPIRETFTHYRHDPENPDSLSNHEVWDLMLDNNGRLWVATFGGLNLFVPETNDFLHYTHDPYDDESLAGNYAVSLLQDSQGRIWVGTFNGLSRYDVETDLFVNYRNDPDNPRSLGHNRVRDVVEDRQGRLWVATLGGGLELFDPRTGEFTHYRQQPDNPASISNNFVATVHDDGSGALWVGTYEGLNLFDPQTGRFQHILESPGNPHSLSNNAVFQVYGDRGGVIWVATDGGVSRYHPSNNRFLRIGPAAAGTRGLSEAQVTSVIETGDGDLWVGTRHRGLNRISRQTLDFRVFASRPNQIGALSDNWVTALFEDREGNLWVGTGTGGLNRYDPHRERFLHLRYDPDNPKSIPGNLVAAMLQDREDVLWVGTDKGLAVLDPGTLEFQNITGAEPSQISALCQRVGGALWAGSHGGAGPVNVETGEIDWLKHQAFNSQSLSHNVVWSVFEDSRRILWIGTNGGLNRYDDKTGRFRRFREADGLINDLVYGILEDNDGYLWIGTYQGLSRLDVDTSTFTNYTLDGALAGNSFRPRACARTADAELLFGGNRGLTLFRPDSMDVNRHAPPIFLEATDTGGRPFMIEENQLKLAFRNNHLTFAFAALDYVKPEQNNFAYKLEPMDKEWIYSGKRRFASYMDLSPGQYHFKVKAANNDGLWNEEGITLDLKIVPPFYRTRWFALVLVFDGVIGLVLVFLFQRKRLERQKYEAVRALDLARKTEELEFARKVQLSMLPDAHLDLGDIEVMGRMQTASEVGGDYFDYIQLSDHRTCIVCGDATGHGMSAGLIVGMTKAALINLVKNASPIQKMMEDMNLTLYESITQRSIGMGLVVNLLNIRSKQVEISSAGMPYPLHFKAASNQLESLVMKCPPLGFMRRLPLQSQSLQLEAGDALIFLSDGFSDRINPEGELWGEAGMAARLQSICSKASSAGMILRHFFDAADIFARGRENEDDMTMVVIRVKDTSVNGSKEDA